MTPFPQGIEVFATDLFLPSYRDVEVGRWELRCGGMAVAPGYWSPPSLVPEMVALLRDGVSWMSLSPCEIESCEIGVRAAAGEVLVHGLGMGWVAAASAALDAVTSVTVVEIDPEVITLHRELDLFAQLPEAARAKIRIVEGDALAYRPDRPVDLLMPDIWLPYVSDGRIDEIRTMQANVDARAIYFWGQELEIARHAAAAGRALDAEGVAATIAAFDLPLIGAAVPGYPDLVARAAAQWMRGRWLEATPN